MVLEPETIQTLAINVAVLGATVLLLKQWLRSDVERVEATVVAIDARQDELQSQHDDALKDLDNKAQAAIAKLADTVDRFIQEASHERLRKTETDALQDRNFEARLVGLEITTQQIGKAVDRIGESVDVLLRRDAS